ncbi:MAG: phage/plasmid primase, P4 family [Eubacteriales bacterium]|nr:phage/plasmid primase, P4 family [Eubacteriales bacterium]
MSTNFTLFAANYTQNAKNTTYPTAVLITDVKSLQDAICYDHVCAKYKDNRRSEANFEYSDCIPMDCDNDHSDDPADWKTPEDVSRAFPGASFGIAYSRSHMKEKNGKAARPKFHVYFPVERVTDAKKYVAMKQQLLQKFPWFDANAVDAARFFFGSSGDADFVNGSTTVDKLLPEIILSGRRNAVMSQKAACIIKRHGDTEEANSLFMAEATNCVPPLDQAELASIWNSARKFGERISGEAGYIPPEDYHVPADDHIVTFLKEANPAENPKYPWTDLGAGQLFADCYKHKARYVPKRKSWFVYHDGVWERDIEGMRAMEFCKDFASAMLVYASYIRDDRKRQDFLKYCGKWQSRKGRETFLKDAQSNYCLTMEDFDQDLFAFNCCNGTLHLDTMEFTEHRPEDFLTKISIASYDPSALSPRFEQFIDEICSGDRDKARFLQKALGYALSGDTRLECFFILYGAESRNGKGTLCESVLKVMGSYGCSAPPETIGINLHANSHAPSEDIARLAGTRFVNISEPDKGLVLNSAKIKSMTGNDTITARFLHENSFDFKPRFKLFINTNHQPVINDMPMFQSGRVKVIPFNKHFEAHEQDHTLKTEFLKPENQSAILNWLIEGWRMLQAEGLEMPESVQSAVAEYQRDSDKIMLFVEEMLERGDSYEAKSAEIYSAYRDWCSRNGYGTENIKNFNQAIRRIATIARKRPAGGGNQTSIVLGYKLSGHAMAL